MRRPDGWTPPRTSRASAALEAYDAYQHLRNIDLRRVTDRRLRAQVRDARDVAYRVYMALWNDPELSAARTAWYEARRAQALS